jgi:hypothetical protein
MGLSEWDPSKKHAENEDIKRNVQIVESNKGGDRKMVKKKGN